MSIVYPTENPDQADIAVSREAAAALSNDLTANDEILELMVTLEKIPGNTAQIIKSFSDDLEHTTKLLDTIDRVLPHLTRKKTIFGMIVKILNGQIDYDTVKQMSLPQEQNDSNSNGAKPKRFKKSFVGKRFIKRAHPILTDAVIDKIAEFIGEIEDYRKGKEIFHYLIKSKIISSTDFKSSHAFANNLARVDQDRIIYDKRSDIMGWGLPDFGTKEHAERKSLKILAKKHRKGATV